MISFNAEQFLAYLPDTTEIIDISHKNITFLPDLTRFTQLKQLYCNDNQLTYLPNNLPDTLEKINCTNNLITCLPNKLPNSLITLYCANNLITCLTNLPKQLNTLFCSDNQLTCIPNLPETLKYLYCYNNQLTYLPNLPETLCAIVYNNNPIHEIITKPVIVQHSSWLATVKQQVSCLNKFRYLYYSVKYKPQFRKWLWEKVRKPKIEKKYHPKHLEELLTNENADLDDVLHNW
jgi:hypothetical protein